MANTTSRWESEARPTAQTPARPSAGPGRGWVAPVVVLALVVALAGLGVGAYAVATTPAKTSGPVGARGPTGPQGPPGAAGRPGVAGPAGTIAATSVVQGTALKTPPDPAVGTVLAAKTSCPTGKVLLSGGAQVFAPGVLADRNVALRTSYPYSSTQWQTVAIVTGHLGAGVAMTMQPYVVCGAPAATSPSTTTPTTA